MLAPAVARPAGVVMASGLPNQTAHGQAARRTFKAGADSKANIRLRSEASATQGPRLSVFGGCPRLWPQRSLPANRVDAVLPTQSNEPSGIQDIKKPFPSGYYPFGEIYLGQTMHYPDARTHLDVPPIKSQSRPLESFEHAEDHNTRRRDVARVGR